MSRSSGYRGRVDALLPVVCWCEEEMTLMTAQEVWDGIGWACRRPECRKPEKESAA